jgi:hypothetical protein
MLLSVIFKIPLIKQFRHWKVVKDAPQDTAGQHEMKLGVSQLSLYHADSKSYTKRNNKNKYRYYCNKLYF